MARIKITDLPVMEELGQEQLQGIYGEGIFPEGGIRKLTAAVALGAGLAGAPWVLAGGRGDHGQAKSQQQQHVQAKIPVNPTKAAGQLQKVTKKNVVSTTGQGKSIATKSLKAAGAGIKTPKLSKAAKAAAVIAAQTAKATADKNYVDAQNYASTTRGYLGNNQAKYDQANAQVQAARATGNLPAINQAIAARDGWATAVADANFANNAAQAAVGAATTARDNADAALKAATGGTGKGPKK